MATDLAKLKKTLTDSAEARTKFLAGITKALSEAGISTDHATLNHLGLGTDVATGASLNHRLESSGVVTIIY